VGVIGPSLPDGALWPVAFHATTEHVYGAPFVSPATTSGLLIASFDPAFPLGEVQDATNTSVGDDPSAPASNDTVTDRSPAVRELMVGAPGTDGGGGGDVTVSISPPAPHVLLDGALVASPL
jgi:hypothetical protein